MNIPSQKWIIDLLVSLGESKREVAYNLGTAGTRGDGQNCPLAFYLRQFYPNVEFKVGNTMIQWEGQYVLLNRFDLLGIAEFIGAFDMGEFKWLDLNKIGRKHIMSHDNPFWSIT
jgi:hypothetical protein